MALTGACADTKAPPATTVADAPRSAAAPSAQPVKGPPAPVSTETPEIDLLPMGKDASISSEPPPMPSLASSGLTAPPLAWQRGCNQEHLSPPALLTSSQPVRRHPGPCRETTYENGKPKAHAVYRYDSLGRLAVDFYFAREREEPLSLYFKNVYTYDDAGVALGWTDDDGDQRCNARDAKTTDVMVTKDGATTLSETITRDDAGRPVRVQYPTGRATGYGWNAEPAEPADDVHVYRYDPKARMVEETMRTEVFGKKHTFGTFTRYREDGQPDTVVRIRLGAVDKWEQHHYDGAGNLLRHESRDRDGKVRVRVTDYGCWTPGTP